MAGCCLLAIVLLLPETNRALVGNGGLEPSRFSRPVIPGIMRPWADNRGPSAPVASRKNRVPNPIESLRVLSRKDVAVTIIPGSILYMIYSCIHTSLATTFIDSYGFSQLQAGLIYLPFGVGAIISTAVSGKWIDRDYRVVAKAHGLPINKVSGDDLLHFPIEEARMRSVFIPTFSALLSVLAYGWLVNEHVVSATSLTTATGSVARPSAERETACRRAPDLSVYSWILYTDLLQRGLRTQTILTWNLD